MKQLANFSIETDTVVLLEFQDGKTERVAVWQLAKHLVEADLRRVRAALQLRRDFMRTHVPKLGVALVVVAGVVAALMGGGGIVAHVAAPSRPAAVVPSHDAAAPLVAPAAPVVVASTPSPDAMQPSAPAITASPAPVASTPAPQSALQAAVSVETAGPPAATAPVVAPRTLRVLGLSLNLGGLLGGGK